MAKKPARRTPTPPPAPTPAPEASNGQAEPSGDLVTIELLLADDADHDTFFRHRPSKVEIPALTHSQQLGLHRLWAGLVNQRATKHNRRPVVTKVDALRWLLEELADPDG